MVERSKTSTARSRVYRERKRKGIVAFPVELPKNAIAALVALRWLNADQQADIEAVKAAYASFVTAAFRSRITTVPRGN